MTSILIVLLAAAGTVYAITVLQKSETPKDKTSQAVTKPDTEETASANIYT